MAELEVIKHTKKAFKIWGSEHPLWKKISEFLLEIFIIVFAVSLSIWFHNWSEHRAEQKQVKVFLTGLNSDIRRDIADTKQIIATYKYYDTAYSFLSNLRGHVMPDKDSLHLFISAINSNTFLQPHRSRFDGFISSGKLLNIEPDSLVENILLYYQEGVPAIKASEGGWLSTHAKLLTYIADNIQVPGDDSAYWKLLTAPKGKYLCKFLVPSQQLYDRYNQFITVGQSIIHQVNDEYPEK